MTSSRICSDGHARRGDAPCHGDSARGGSSVRVAHRGLQCHRGSRASRWHGQLLSYAVGSRCPAIPPAPRAPRACSSPGNAGAHSDPLTQSYAAAADVLSTAAQRRGGAAFAGVLRAAPPVDARRWGPCRRFSGRVVGAPAFDWERRAHRKARVAGVLGMEGNDRGMGWEEGGDAKNALNEVRVAREGGVPRVC